MSIATARRWELIQPFVRAIEQYNRTAARKSKPVIEYAIGGQDALDDQSMDQLTGDLTEEGMFLQIKGMPLEARAYRAHPDASGFVQVAFKFSPPRILPDDPETVCRVLNAGQLHTLTDGDSIYIAAVLTTLFLDGLTGKALANAIGNFMATFVEVVKLTIEFDESDCDFDLTDED